MIDRLDHVGVEAGLVRSLAVLFLPPAGQRDEHQLLRPTAVPGCAGTPRSRSASAGRCPAARRRAGTRSAASTASTPSWACVRLVAARSRSSIASDSAPSSVVVHDQDAVADPRSSARSSAAGAIVAEASASDRQAHDELAPAAEPLAARLDRAAVHLHQPLHQRQADAQPVARPLQRRVHLREHLEEAGKLFGGDADAGVPHANDRLVAFAASTVSQMWPPRSVYLHALFSRLPITCASRAGSALR